jgi:hypothetical protein
MTLNEENLVARLRAKAHIADIKVTRRSEKEYDLSVSGLYAKDSKHMAGVAISAWLPLLAIRELTPWPSEEIASFSDYPDMVMEGDWSGIRDSSVDSIWRMFDRFVLS